MKKMAPIVVSVILIAVVIVASGVFYVMDETEQVVVTQFGKPVGEPVKEAGLRVKVPFIQTVNRLDKRILEWDGVPVEMPTKDKTYIKVDTFARWRICDPLQFFLRLRDERSAQSRLDDILGSETRNAIANHPLIEVIRTDKNREPKREAIIAGGPASSIGILPPIDSGRSKIEHVIFSEATGKLKVFGIELLDVRFKRINYNPDVQNKIYERMISERQQIAERFRSEGQGEAARILGRRSRELREIESEAYRTAQKIMGDADAKATEIYAKAYNQSKASAMFYEFLKTLETYEKVIDKDTILLLSTKSDLFKILKSANPKQ
ncbi:MAG: protease modulator HflC [Pseudomonadota bacterium]